MRSTSSGLRIANLDTPNAATENENLESQVPNYNRLTCAKMEEKIRSYQNTKRERLLTRELKRLQAFQTFLVSQIDQLGRHRSSNQLAKEINDLKRVILELPCTPTTDELTQTNKNTMNERKRTRPTKHVSSQTITNTVLLSHDDNPNNCSNINNDNDNDNNNYNNNNYDGSSDLSNTIVMSPTGSALSLPSLFNKNNNADLHQKQIFIEEKEVHAAFEYANQNFEKAYREMQQKAYDLTEKLLERDNELIETRLQLERLKHELLANGNIKRSTVNDAIQKETEMLKLRLYDKMDENKRLRRRLKRNNIRAIVLERHKKEIIRLQMKCANHTRLKNNISPIRRNKITVTTTPQERCTLGSPKYEYQQTLQSHKVVVGDKNMYTQSLLRKNSELKGHNYTLMAQRNFLIAKLSNGESVKNFIVKNGGHTS